MIEARIFVILSQIYAKGFNRLGMTVVISRTIKASTNR